MKLTVTRGNPLKMEQICTYLFEIHSNMNSNTSDIGEKKSMC